MCGNLQVFPYILPTYFQLLIEDHSQGRECRAEDHFPGRGTAHIVTLSCIAWHHETVKEEEKIGVAAPTWLRLASKEEWGRESASHGLLGEQVLEGPLETPT